MPLARRAPEPITLAPTPTPSRLLASWALLPGSCMAASGWPQAMLGEALGKTGRGSTDKQALRPTSCGNLQD